MQDLIPPDFTRKQVKVELKFGSNLKGTEVHFIVIEFDLGRFSFYHASYKAAFNFFSDKKERG